MAEALLGLGSTGASSLNQELIDKLKAAERKATVEPIESDIENITADIEKFDEVNQAVLDVLDAIRPFDLFVTGGVNAFEEKSASTTGSSVLFDATDVTSLNNGMTTVEVTQIGQKDVFQSDLIASANIYDSNGDGIKFTTTKDFNISIGGATPISFSTSYVDSKGATQYYSYDELVKNINDTDGISASLDEVSNGQYRLVVKSEEVGIANELTFSGTLARSLGFTANVNTSSTFTNSTDTITTDDYNLVVDIDGSSTSINVKNMSYSTLVDTLNTNYGINLSASIVNNTIKIEDKNGEIIDFSINENSDVDLNGTVDTNVQGILDFKSSNYNHLQNAQDMKMTVDGVVFESASNKIVVDGLTINATTTGISTITIDDDTSYLTTQVQNFIDAYNNLAELVDENTQADSEMYNKTGLKAIVNTIKEMMFSTYGEETLGREPKSLFEYGLGLDADLSGKITLDETVFAEAVANDLDGLRQLFIGTAVRDEDLGTNDRGFGTLLKETLDGMFFSKGLVSQFETSLTNREETLNTDLKKAEETLDSKYAQLTAQFSAYASIITQFETAFGGLKMMIDQSIATSN